MKTPTAPSWKPPAPASPWWQGKEIWIQHDGRGQLLIGVDVEEGDAEYANLLMRPLATNLMSLQLEMEPADVEGDDDDHVHGPGCNH